jgi:hypothetical protein
VKFLTIRQPWASLIAVGAKTIETRPFSTKYRGPLAIHAGATRPANFEHHNVNDDPPPWVDLVAMSSCWLWTEHDDFYHGGLYRWCGPLGAVVAVCDLVDVVPILGVNDILSKSWQRHVAPTKSDGKLGLWSGPQGYNQSLGRGTWRIDDIEAQRPFGDFTPGRYAWLLDNVRPIEPVPMKGAQGLRDLPAEIAAAVAS